MGVALEILGYKVCGVRYDLIEPVRQKKWQPIAMAVEDFDAFQDNPWPVLFRELDLHYPGSKFILTLRDETAWLNSLLNHFNTTPSKMQDLIYGQPYPKGHEDLYLSTYRKHNQDVLAYFNNRPADLLVLDLTVDNDWSKLCEFVRKPVPTVSFPHENKGKYTPSGKALKYLRKKLRLLFKKIGLIREK